MGPYACLLFAFCLFFLLCFKQGAAQRSSVVRKKNPEYHKKNITRYGMASFYAKKFGGRTTSDGSSYNSVKLTAACNALPLGTWVKVTNLKNHRSVVVEINDHLHHRTNRLIDLSKYAAQKLGIISRGLARVKVEVLDRARTKRIRVKRIHHKAS